MATAVTPPEEIPFTPAAWPESGSACGIRGYDGLLGQVEAINARTIRFTLCEPDGAFLARIAHPALGILDTAAIERLASDPGSARSLAGTGPYRIDRWDSADAVILVRAGTKSSAAARSPTVVIRWAADGSRRTDDLQAAAVDGIDAPGPSDLERIATLPEIVVAPRPGLSTAYLAFGSGTAFDDTHVRRAIAGALDRATLAEVAFPPGSVVPTHVMPCVIESACAGRAWFPFNAPAAAATIAATSFDLDATYQLHVPDQAIPGLPQPLAAAEEVKAQLGAYLGIKLTIDIIGVDDFNRAVAAGTLDGLYLAGVASELPDPAAFLEPLFGSRASGVLALRADGVQDRLAEAAETDDPEARMAAFGKASDAIRSSIPLVPLVNPGSVAAFRADVADVVTSPLGIEPLGAFRPGDRHQLVFMQATEPDGAWCGDQGSADAFRLCALVQQGLYGLAPGTLAVEPRLATGCSPDDDTSTWTCTLRRGVTFTDGARLDAGDVLATYVAAWDADSPLRAARPGGNVSVVGDLFGALLPAGWDQP
jgi:ABC-type transport system substrate-binding protein